MHVRMMIRVDTSDEFRRSGRSLATDPPAPVPPSVAAHTAKQRAVLEEVGLALALRRYREHVGGLQGLQVHEEVSAWLARREA